MELTQENLSKFFPYYFTEERKTKLSRMLAKHPIEKPYYASQEDNEPLQGDCWSGLTIYRFDDGIKDQIKGMVLTNSCDLAKENNRLFVPKLSFVPIIDLEKYLVQLKASGIEDARIAQHAKEIRAQEITSFFYLPANETLEKEHIAILHDVHSIPANACIAGNRRASLSDVGFYIFIFKLSIHFCRLQENVDRG